MCEMMIFHSYDRLPEGIRHQDPIDHWALRHSGQQAAVRAVMT